MPVRGKIEARHGALKDALTLVADAVQLAQTTDALNCHAKTRMDQGEIFIMAGRAEEARTAFSEALELYDKKGNVVARGSCALVAGPPRVGLKRQGPRPRALCTFEVSPASSAGAAAVRISDERCREREQTDCEHDERAMQ